MTSQVNRQPRLQTHTYQGPGRFWTPDPRSLPMYPPIDWRFHPARAQSADIGMPVVNPQTLVEKEQGQPQDKSHAEEQDQSDADGRNETFLDVQNRLFDRMKQEMDEYMRRNPDASLSATWSDFFRVKYNDALRDEIIGFKMNSLVDELKSTKNAARELTNHLTTRASGVWARRLRKKSGRSVRRVRSNRHHKTAGANMSSEKRRRIVRENQRLARNAAALVEPGVPVKLKTGVTDAIVLCFGDFVYLRNRTTAKVAYFRCWNWVRGCKATVIVSIATGEIRYGKAGCGAHCGGCTYAAYIQKHRRRAELERLKEFVVQRARDLRKTATEIYQELRMSFMSDLSEKKIICTEKQVSYWVSLVRNTKGGLEEYRDLELVPHFSDPSRLIPWLRKYVVGTNGFMFFMSDQQLEKLLPSPIWMIDATFRAAPHPYKQLLNIMAVRPWAGHEKYYPCAHVLMQRSDEKAYREAICQILELTGQSPGVREVITDFEAALRNGVQLAFQSRGIKVVCRGCLFHFSQALTRAFRKLGKTTLLQKKIVWLLMWAPYMNQSLTKNMVEELGKRKTGIESFIKYFRDYWMPRISWWSVSDSSWDIVTNCALEGYHGKLRSKGQALYKPVVRGLSEMLFELDHNIMIKNDFEELFGKERWRKKTRMQFFNERKEVLETEFRTIHLNFEVADGNLDGVTPLSLEDQKCSAPTPEYMSKLLDSDDVFIDA